jgi:hypothetical protein
VKYDNIEFENNSTFNNYLLFKYLTLEYINQGADETQAKQLAENLILKYKDHLYDYKGLAYSLGERNFEYFCTYFLQDTFVPKEDNTARNLAQVHLDVWHELQQMFIEDKWDREEFILPRGASKSTIINKALSCYLHSYRKSRYTIVIGNKEQDAVQFISATRKMLENPYIIKAFGKLIDKKDRTLNKQEVELVNNSKIQAFSWGSSVRGTTYDCIDGTFRPSCIICDDVLSEDDILSDNAKEKVLNKFYKEISEVGDSEVLRDDKKIKSSSKFLVIGTPLAPDDFINAIKKDPMFKVFHRKALNFNPDKYFENNSYWQHYKKILMDDRISKEDKDIMLKEYYTKYKKEMEFPTIWEKYRCDTDIAQKYFNKRIAFMQELMCDCENIGTKWFKSIRTQTEEEIEDHNFIKTMLVCDPASSVDNRADYSALLVGSIADNDFTYIRKGIIERLNFPDFCFKVIELLKKFKDVQAISIEKNLYMGTDILKIQELISKDTELFNRDIQFINNTQHRNKDEKISTIVDSVNNGQIIFNEEDKEFIKQIKDFAGQKYTLHDDAIDDVAQFTIDVKEIEVIGTIDVIKINF